MSDDQPSPPDPVYRFDRYELRPQERQLLADGETAKLGGRAFDMLVALVERRDRVVSKHELMDIVWPKLVVEENNLQAQVMALRKLLGPAAIATVPGRGYRLALPVEAVGTAFAGGSTAASPSPAPRRDNLPGSVEPMIGREHEFAQLDALVRANRLVTVTGSGGVGKSRLVIEVAAACVDRYADGVWLVELAALGEPAQLPASVNSALGITVAPAQDPLRTLTTQLANRRMLLVLDNCEHLIAAVASLLEAILTAAPNVYALASSQELLGIAGEQVFRLPSLAVPAVSEPTAADALAAGAVQLFVARAKAADPRFVFDDRVAPVVAAICRRLDGIPLALEMAAGRVPLLGIDALASRLDERFRILTAGKRTALPRQRTLHATLDWSFGLLTPHEQAVFRRLGVFAGQFSLEAAVAVVSDGERDEFDVIETLAGLCAKSLLTIEPGADEARYRLLETNRAYSLERLAGAKETPDTTRRHAISMRRFFEPCFDDWTRLSDSDFRQRYLHNIDDLRLAVAWAFGPEGDGDTAIALVGSSARAWVALSLYAEAEALLDRALDRLTSLTPAALEADLWSAVAAIHGQRNLFKTDQAARRASVLYRSRGDRLRLGCALNALGNAHAAEADAEAEPALLEARPLLEGSGRPRLLAMSRASYALFHGARGNPGESMKEARAAIELWQAAGAESSVLRTLGSLADQIWAQGDLDGAIDATRDALERHRLSPFSDRVSRAYATANLFGMLVERGDLAEARSIGRVLLPELLDLGITHGWMDHFALLAGKAGDAANPARLVGWADALRIAKKLNRQPNEERARKSTLTLARESVPGGEVDRLMAEGATMSDADAFHMALP